MFRPLLGFLCFSLGSCNSIAVANWPNLKDLPVRSPSFKKILRQAKHLQITRAEGQPLSKRGVEVKVKFTLHMENLTVASVECQHAEQHIDRLTICWISEMSEQDVLSMSGRWISSKDFLLQKMTDLRKVGESSLTIEPVEELTAD
jgi:hypothetical protein